MFGAEFRFRFYSRTRIFPLPLIISRREVFVIQRSSSDIIIVYFASLELRFLRAKGSPRSRKRHCCTYP